MTGEQFKFAFPQPILPLDTLFSDPQGEASLKILRQWQKWPKPFVGLTGPERSGVTTVLKSWAEDVGGRYLRPEDWQRLDAKALSELLDQPLAIDDCDVSMNPVALLTLLNLARHGENAVLLGGHGQPQSWASSPPDLVSRLSAMTTIVLPVLDDAMMISRLRAACLRRYIKVPQETLAYLEPRLERSYQAIEAFASELDRQMSETGRSASIPLARTVLDTLSDNPEDEDQSL